MSITAPVCTSVVSRAVVLLLTMCAAGDRINAGEPQVPAKLSGTLFTVHERHLVALTPNGDRPKRILKLAMGIDTDKGVFPAFWRVSPDGRQLAYLDFAWAIDRRQPNLANDSPIKGKLVVHDWNKRATTASWDIGPMEFSIWCWSGDGMKLAASFRDDQVEDRFVFKHKDFDLQTKKIKPLSIPQDHFVTDWSPDGEQFLTTSFGAGAKPAEKRNARVSLVSKNGREIRRLSRPGVSSLLGRFAPDGKNVLFVTNKSEDGTGQVFVTDIHGKPPHAVSREIDGCVTGACWSPDGKRIAYAWSKVPPKLQANVEPEQVEVFLMQVDADGTGSKVLLSEKRQPGVDYLVEPALDWR